MVKPVDNSNLPLPDNYIVDHKLNSPLTVNGQRLQVIITRIGLDDVSVSYKYPPHQHQEYEVIFIEQGVYKCLLNDKELTASKGDILIAQPGDWHVDFCTPSLKYYNIMFVVNNIFEDNKFVPIFRNDIAEMEKIVKDPKLELISTIKSIYEDYRPNDIISTNIRNAKLLEIFWLLIKNIPDHLFSTEFKDLIFQSNFCSELFQIFEQNLSNTLKVKQIAEKMNMSERSLTDNCHKMLGPSPAKAFLNYKMQKAKSMLTETAMTIKEVSAYLGFANQYHFSRCFKATFGNSPSSIS